MILLHLGTLHLAVECDRVSPWHRLTPRTRVLCAFLFVFASSLTPNGRWLTWLVYGLGLLVLIGISRVSLPVLLRRVGVEFLFIAAVLLGTLFRPGGEPVLEWGWLRITTEGLTVLASVTLKAALALLMLNLLVLTTTIPKLFHALSELRTPPLLVAILASMYRYIGVLLAEFTAMRRAALCRNLMSHPRWHRQVVGNMLGSLFIRTYERGDRIHQAMLARGYSGLPPLEQTPQSSAADPLALTLMTLLLLLGQAVYLALLPP
jgi:cobalt/nickel transport system permease protein